MKLNELYDALLERIYTKDRNGMKIPIDDANADLGFNFKAKFEDLLRKKEEKFFILSLLYL